MEDESSETDDEVEVHTIGYKLRSPHFDQQALLAESYLLMPSGTKIFDSATWSTTRLVMDLKDLNDNHCLKLMMTCPHKNILHAKMVTAESNYHVAWTEPFTDFLLPYLQSLKIDLADSHDMIPSPQLQSIVREWLDGIEQLRLYGKYHGNFLLDNQYYYLDAGWPIVKLTNFRVKVRSEEFLNYSNANFLLQCQVEDVFAVAHALDEIQILVEQWAMARETPTLDCTLLVDLAKKLREVSVNDLASVMKDIKRHMFFWGKPDRARFYICDLPYALGIQKFREDVESSNDICSIPWDNDHYCGLLQNMNDYRRLHNQSVYDGSKKTQFCSFCSGLYTHEFELPACKSRHGVSVDYTLQSKRPRTCFEIVSLMPDRETKYMLSKREDKK